MICSTCGKQIDPDSAFCSYCGSEPIRKSNGRIWNVGRDFQNDIVEDYPMVSAQHCRIVLLGGNLFIEDLESTNGTYLNRSRVPPFKETPLNPGDAIHLGTHQLALDLNRIIGTGPGAPVGASDPQAISILERETIIGRDPACTICLDYPQVSWHHARLIIAEGGFFLEDLASTNGTYLNGLRINACPVTERDTISISSFSFTLTPNNRIEKRDYRRDIRLAADNITVEVYDKKARSAKKLLGGVSLTVYPSEFVGVMGPSGSGKTTLLLALNGYLPPQSGRSLVNGQSLYASYDAFRTCIGYVPQDDILHPELTVFEALYYTAKLRLPIDTTEKEIRVRIVSVLTQLGLMDTKRNIDIRNVIIGSAETKGISGGQRKRLNLAMELLTDPSLLFLDEPTSGLSSEDAVNVMDVLRGLANKGKTIILVIHQPSLEIYKKLDNLIILSCGRLMYYGPAYPDSITFFNPGQPHEEIVKNADNTLKGLSLRHEREWAAEYHNSIYFRQYVEDRKNYVAASRRPENSKPPISFDFLIKQWWTLTSRFFTVKRKDHVNTGILLLQAPVIAILVSVVFHGKGDDNQAAVPLFLVVIAALWFGISNSVREVVSEKAIYTRERMVNLKISAYVLSKYMVLGCFCLFQCAILVGIIHPSVQLKGSFSGMLWVTFLASLAGLSIGLFLSSVTRTQQAAIAIVPLVLLPMVILGGAMLSVKDMGDSAHFLSRFVPSRWAFEHIIQIEDSGKESEETNKQTEISNSVDQTSASVRPLNSYSSRLFGDRSVENESVLFLVIGIYIFSFVAMTMLALRLRDKV
jgi:ABC transport system ATP-binding/permease protein